MLAAATTAAIVTAAVTAIATAAMTTAVTVLQTVCTACRPVFTVRDRSSLRNAMLLGSVGVLGETVLGERLRGGGAGAGGQDPEQEPTREQEQGEGGAPATAAATATVTATVATTATATGDVATLVRRVRTLRSVSALGGVFRGYHLPFKLLRLSGIANRSRGHGLDHGCPRSSSVPEH